jgi:hypothetical protein
MSAVEKLNAIVSERKEARASLWGEVQSRSPVLAKILEEARRVFGKPERFTVRFL